eukprot:c29083_g3_i2 orf=880-3219(+)
MERTEPSFVPEWLKGGNGSCGNLTAYQVDTQFHQANLLESRQRSPSVGGNHVEIDSPRYSPASDRVFHPLSGRASSNSCLNERSTYDRDITSQSRSYSNYRRGATSRLQDVNEHEQGCVRGDNEHDQDWEREQFRERERDRFLGFGNGDERERFHDRSEEALNWRHGMSASGRYDLDLSLKRSLSWGSPNKSLENESPRHVIESGSLLGGSSVASGSLASNIQKAAFERNFPSLGSQEKPSGLQSSLGDVSALSMRPFWQGSTHTHKVDGSRSSSPGLVSVGSGIVLVNSSGLAATEGWSSALAEGPVSSGNFLSTNGSVVTSPSKAVQTIVTGPTGNTPGTQQSIPKMAEALLQNQPRVRTPPQQSTESQRLEELALKQSRQLIPMKPSLPKTMGQGLSARDKPKPKTGRVPDAVATSVPKLGQPKALPQPLNPLYRASMPTRPETAKSQPGMLVVQKISKEAMVTAVSGVSSGKLDSISPCQVSTFSSTGVGIPVGSASMVNTGLNFPRKPKQLVDRRVVAAMPVPVVSESGAMVRLKDGASGIDDKKLSMQAQNRSDFFNALRRQAAGASGPASDHTDTSEATSKQKSEEVSANEEFCESGSAMVEGSTITASVLEEGSGGILGCRTGTPLLKVEENGAFFNTEHTSSKFDTGIPEVKKGDYLDGDILEGTKDILGRTATANSLDMALRNVPIVGGSEEEEAAFLRSLGWVEDPDNGEEALTEEEIATFLKEHMPAMTSHPLGSQFILRLKRLGVGAIDKVESAQSSHSFSDSEFQ